MATGTKAYIAAPIVGVSKEHKEQIQKVAEEALRRLADRLYLPWEMKIPNAWNMPLEQWARCVFTQDVMAIEDCDWVVVCDFGRYASCGTAWEAGYAFGKGKEVIVVTMPGVEEVSLMIHNGCSCVISYEEFVSDEWSFKHFYSQDDQLVQN